MGSTITAIPGDGITKRFPDVAFDDANDAYLVITGLRGGGGARRGAQRHAPRDHGQGQHGHGRRVARDLRPGINRCLIVWLQEPNSVIGRFVRYNSGAVLPLTAPFTIGTSGLLTSSPPGVVYSSGSNEFLVVWTDGLNNVRGQRVDASGAKVGAVIPVAMTSLWEGFPTLAYNSAQNEYNVGYYFETSTGASSVGTQRVKPGTGALIGSRSTLYSGGFNYTPSWRTTRRPTSTWRSAGDTAADHG